MAEESKPIWEGKTSAELGRTTAERVWPLLEDFCNIHKWLPLVETCYRVEGAPGQPGLVRYCASTKMDSDAGAKWCKEKLLTMDPIQRCFSYEIVDNNVGFKSYVATIKVLPVISDEKPEGCKVEWSFVCDPVEGWTFESFYSFIQSSLQSIVKKIELAGSDSHEV